VTICKQCGTRNPDTAETCYSCGAPLHDDDEGQPTIIDVSNGGAEIYTRDDEPQAGWFSTYVGQARVYQVRGGNRTCLVIVAIVLLLICCVCVGWWTVADSIFF
jgi:hypothetical protein